MTILYKREKKIESDWIMEMIISKVNGIEILIVLQMQIILTIIEAQNCG